jgi:uncharacterized protein with gpF-like domain
VADPHVVGEAVLAIQQRDWSRLTLLLHPYIHWTDSAGRTTRGRKNALALLQSQAAPTGPPSSHELRDGQIYRWAEPRPRA